MYCGGDSKDPGEYAVLLWNDEKHTVQDVQQQVARACRVSSAKGMERAYETDAIGRSIVMYDTDIEKLVEVAEILERIRVTVTIRSARDTFREQMCGGIVEWLLDISGCSVGNDNFIMRQLVCEELLKTWSRGSPATHAMVGNIDDENKIEESGPSLDQLYLQQAAFLMRAREAARGEEASDDEDDDVEEQEEQSIPGDMEEDGDDDDIDMLDATDLQITDAFLQAARQELEIGEATMGGFPPPPPPPPPAPAPRARNPRDRDLTPSDSDTADPLIPNLVYSKSGLEIPKTPGLVKADEKQGKPGVYWKITPEGYVEQDNLPVRENIFERVRLDWLVLFDLRMWKKVRNDLRSLYISTVVAVPEFKRILGLRFAGLYTTLAQLYLIGDREPDHSIINLSLQILTTPSITAEVVERGNFLTNLMAILYTFLTARQVGNPWDVSSTAVLSFDTGSVTNRRMYHFFLDLKYLMASPHVQEKLRTEQRYIMQFLDLVKLHQGICPNVRAVGEHIEYEADGWISASLITREVNRLCRQFSEAFRNLPEWELHHVADAVRLVAKTVIINSIGAERHRFQQAEIKDEVKFKTLADFEFEDSDKKFDVVKFVVEEQPISFHHALHYTLSYLIESGKSMPVRDLRGLLTFTAQELDMPPRSMGKKWMPKSDWSPEDYLMALFDYPLRVCAWLAQMKAGMWVRNGLSLRHQAGTYRGVVQRDVSHHRDIFLLQTALVVCDPSRVLASIVERFGMEKWVKGLFEQKSRAQDDAQHLDVVEDMVHLLIVLLSDRTSLMQNDDQMPASLLAMRRDLIHVLCFKPLSFSDIGQKLPDKFQDHEDFQDLLNEMTTFKAPEGLMDVGTFELKPEYVEEIDPYIAHYNKNQREEAEQAYRKIMAKKTGKQVEDIVYEPKLRPISTGAFTGLADCTKTGMFAQLIYYSLLYALVFKKMTPDVQLTRVETFLQVVLHLILIAISEDNTSELGHSQASFVSMALSRNARSNFMPEAPQAKTIVALLNMMLSKDEYKSSHPKINLILKRMRQKQPHLFDYTYHHLGLSVDRINTASPANALADEEREKKKKAALDRQARVMAQFQQQQKSFMANQDDIDWGDVDVDEDHEIPPAEEHRKFWKYPSGTCIYCQEETDDRQLYGAFAFLMESHIVRQTDLQDPDFVREVHNVPENLDRSADAIRPFGVSGENRVKVQKVNRSGDTFTTEQTTLGKGFPSKLSRPGPVSTGCGHIMHYSCFEKCFENSVRRHASQIARHPPEDVERLEFVCPLCKALGNAFLPIVWKGKEESYPGPLQAPAAFDEWLNTQLHTGYYILGAPRPTDQVQNSLKAYTTQALNSQLAERSPELLDDAWVDSTKRDSTTGGSSFAENFVAVPEGEPSSRGGAEQGSASDGMMKELTAAYRRLRDSIQENSLESRYPTGKWPEEARKGKNELCASDTLARAVGYSISAVEIQQRGVEAEYGLTFLDKIPEQVLTHLRILAETVTSYIAVGGQREAGENHIDTEFRKDSERQHCQLFIAQYLDEETDNTHRPADVYPPLLSLDPFIFLCESVFGVVPAQGFEISHMVRLCYLAEITKAVYHLGRNMPAAQWIDRIANRPRDMDPALQNFAQFCEALVSMDFTALSEIGLDTRGDADAENKAFNQSGLDDFEGWYKFVRTYALAFARKCVVLLNVKYGVDFNSHISPSPEQKELERLTEALKLPSFDEMLTALTPLGPQCGWPADTSRLVSGWVKHQVYWPHGSSEEPLLAPPTFPSGSGTTVVRSGLNHQLPASATLAHPGIFELVGLPEKYGTLIELCTRKRCPTTGRDLSDPMVCLFCGEVFCGQGICCSREMPFPAASRRQKKVTVGGANQHIAKYGHSFSLCLIFTSTSCPFSPLELLLTVSSLFQNRCQKTIGLFLNIRRCVVFMLHRQSGSFAHAPYIDQYGEMDMGLRHGRELFLHQKRYDTFLRNLWLGHGVPSYIARKLEADINSGGWETL
jgi:E3 ubiquitin-protein ligase UBR1